MTDARADFEALTKAEVNAEDARAGRDQKELAFYRAVLPMLRLEPFRRA